MIETLIDKQDGFEIVRDKIAAILALEIANQQVLATKAGKDPNLWNIKIYTERMNAWEQWLNSQTDTSPICNIWVDSATYDPSASNISNRQKSDTIYNIDVYGYGRSADDGGSGHVAGDKEAAFEAHRAYRLVRNILMAAEYTYLDLRGIVWQRWTQSFDAYQPQYNGRAMQNVHGLRLQFRVAHNELSPQAVASVLEWLTITTYRTEDGEILVRADYIDGMPLVERNTYQALKDRTTDKPLIVRE